MRRQHSRELSTCSYLYPSGQERNPELNHLLNEIPEGHVQVDPEQFELYVQIGSTFQLCKICTENDKVANAFATQRNGTELIVLCVSPVLDARTTRSLFQTYWY